MISIFGIFKRNKGRRCTHIAGVTKEAQERVKKWPCHICSTCFLCHKPIRVYRSKKRHTVYENLSAHNHCKVLLSL